ncbi:hypothetical protein HNQ74_001545 [Bartonella doshiae]|nr:hypothetical protein [Bartonella doshiae]
MKQKNEIDPYRCVTINGCSRVEKLSFLRKHVIDHFDR